jgi:hypothetical protein
MGFQEVVAIQQWYRATGLQGLLRCFDCRSKRFARRLRTIGCTIIFNEQGLCG